MGGALVWGRWNSGRLAALIGEGSPIQSSPSSPYASPLEGLPLRIVERGEARIWARSQPLGPANEKSPEAIMRPLDSRSPFAYFRSPAGEGL